MNTIDRIKQSQYPKEFRIFPLGLNEEVLNKLEKLIVGLTKEQITPIIQEVKNEANLNLLAEIAVGVWRMKKKMVDPVSNLPLDEMKKTYRHLESVIFAMEKEGLEIQDHDKDEYQDGLLLKVLTFQPILGLKKQIVMDTIKPSVYFKGERIVLGEVIVGTPFE